MEEAYLRAVWETEKSLKDGGMKSQDTQVSGLTAPKGSPTEAWNLSPGRFLGPGARQRGGSCPGSDLALHSPWTLMLVEAIRTQTDTHTHTHTHTHARILNFAFGSISSTAEPGFATILPSLATTLGPNSHRDRRCLQESWGQITSMYFNTRKQYKWLRFSEDCLYLNVYAPVRARGDAPLPVMVWFPGGAFLVGSASTYDGTQLASREKVVLVLLQHRLGILGFLSTGDSQARGNWALLDQVAALRWVQENIAAFGGDPRCVTLFGQSSGAMCISGLMMSPLARGLFHRAISQRGTAALRAFITPDPLRVAKGFFHLNSQKDPQEVVWFMSPVVDGVVFPDDPAVLLSQGQVAPVPYLLGVNNLEFSWLLPFIMKISLNQFIMRKGIITKLLWRTSTLLNITKEQLPLVMEEYLGDIDDHDWKMLRNRLMGLAGDAIFVYSTLQAAHHHRVSLFLDAGFPVYLYEFEHHTPTGVIIKPCTDGADHGDEIHFIFGNPFSKGHSTVEEKALSLQMMKYWANFARTGNPNGGKLPYWPRYNEEEKYLQLDFITRVGVKLKEEKMAFWMRLYQH
ncbi:carboxylesterase 4A isoform X5 [Neofelis nebulosa]|uniref:carboxylesterase 4A isoform X5 n=1 Tax=Neofelis nebulosa TaxID=61452 RepID=UPI00272BB8DB|nr:carboxylesterase 4A isoform X5 [Neofelis nebulosa]